MRKPQTDTDTKFQRSGVGDGLETHGADRAGFEASVGDTRLQYDSSRAHLNSAKVSSLSFKGTIKCLIDLRHDAEKII